MPTFTATAPDGRKVNATGATMPTEAEWDEIFASTGTQKPSASQVEPVSVTGRRAAATNKMSEADYNRQQDPNTVANWFETKLRPMLEQVAHPQTISDIAALLIPDAAGVATGARAALRASGEGLQSTGRGMEAVGQSPAVQHLSGWTAAGTAAHGDIAKAGALAAAAPALEYGGRGLQAIGEKLVRAGARPAELAAEAAAARRAVVPSTVGPHAGGYANPAADVNIPDALRPPSAPTATPGPSVPPPGAGPVSSPPVAPPAAAAGNNVTPPAVFQPKPATTPANTPPRGVAEPPVTTAPPATKTAAPSPKVQAAAETISEWTPAEYDAVKDLPVKQRVAYLRMRQGGYAADDALSTVRQMQKAEQAQNARAMMHTGDAAREVFGTENAATRAKLQELAPAPPSRVPMNAVTAAMDERFKALISDPKMAWLLPLLGGATLGTLATRKDAP